MSAFRFWKSDIREVREIAPEDIFLESSNLPRRYDPQFEARVVAPLGARRVLALGVVFALVVLIFASRSFNLSLINGPHYAEISRENRLESSVLFATRGIISDRTGKELAWNAAPAEATSSSAGGGASLFSYRRYIALPGLSLLLGFVRYPKADQSGVWWREETSGVSGLEQAFNDLLGGANGSIMRETNARGKVERENIVDLPVEGKALRLSIDADVQTKLFTLLSAHAAEQGFVGGAAAIMDVRTGELLALTSFPEYDNAAFTEGNVAAIRAASNDPKGPLLDRAISGLYAPGSIVKPIFAAAALEEGIVTPETTILSKGAITIPNPYDSSKPSVYRDWSVHGLVNMREALAVSSDEYFYQIGGGYGSQAGLGIQRLDQYARKFGLGNPTGINLLGEQSGVIPTPEWKAAVFGADDQWRLGDTYHTAIGQYGFQITPLQAVRYVAAIANGGRLLTPHLTASSTPEYASVGIPDAYLQVVRDGMRLAVTSDRKDATVKVLNIPEIHIAAKTGTAQIGNNNQWMHSWSVGFWPAEHPKYAYAAVLEKARAGTLSGAAPALRPFFEWLAVYKPQYANEE